jgi:hypothetical protein
VGQLGSECCHLAGEVLHTVQKRVTLGEIRDAPYRRLWCSLDDAVCAVSRGVQVAHRLAGENAPYVGGQTAGSDAAEKVRDRKVEFGLLGLGKLNGPSLGQSGGSRTSAGAELFLVCIVLCRCHQCGIFLRRGHQSSRDRQSAPSISRNAQLLQAIFAPRVVNPGTTARRYFRSQDQWFPPHNLDDRTPQGLRRVKGEYVTRHLQAHRDPSAPLALVTHASTSAGRSTATRQKRLAARRLLLN